MREGVVKEERDEHAHILAVTQDIRIRCTYIYIEAVCVTSPRSNRFRHGDPGNGNGMHNSLQTISASFPGPPHAAQLQFGNNGWGPTYSLVPRLSGTRNKHACTTSMFPFQSVGPGNEARAYPNHM